MFAWVRDVYQRHKRKILISGFLVGGLYCASKYLEYKYNQWQEQRAFESARQAKKQYHFESNQRTCSMTFLSFLPNMRNVIADRLNTEELLEVLKLNPANKVEVWELLKVRSFARAIASVVATVTMYVFLKVQMNIMGGYLFIEGAEPGDGSPVVQKRKGALFKSVQVDYLNAVKFLLGDGLNTLSDDVLKAAQDCAGSIPLSERISLERVKGICKEIVASVCERSAFHEESQHPLTSYLISRCCVTLPRADDDEKFKRIMSELGDILRGADCGTVLETCLQATLDQLHAKLLPSFVDKNEDPEAILPADSKDEHYRLVQLPMAKVVPLINAQMHEVFKVGRNEYLDALFSQRTVHDFAANIYETFSSEENY